MRALSLGEINIPGVMKGSQQEGWASGMWEGYLAAPTGPLLGGAPALAY